MFAMTVSATVQSHIAYDLIDEHHPEITVIEFLSRDIIGPHQAEELREQLDSLIWAGVPRNFVIDFANARALGSSAFAVIAGFVRKYGHVRACNMSENLKLGAGLTGLENWVQFADSREAVVREARTDARRGQDETEDYPAMTDDEDSVPSPAES
jgi:anti-anti-sigma regulatory factor